jgi:hypothetical protein
MASSIAPAVPADGSTHVRINGPLARVPGIRRIEIAPARMRLVRAVPTTTPIPQAVAA